MKRYRIQQNILRHMSHCHMCIDWRYLLCILEDSWPEEGNIRLHLDQEAVGHHDVRVIHLRAHVGLRDSEVMGECLLWGGLHRPQVHWVHDVDRDCGPLACQGNVSSVVRAMDMSQHLPSACPLICWISSKVVDLIIFLVMLETWIVHVLFIYFVQIQLTLTSTFAVSPLTNPLLGILTLRLIGPCLKQPQPTVASIWPEMTWWPWSCHWWWHSPSASSRDSISSLRSLTRVTNRSRLPVPSKPRMMSVKNSKLKGIKSLVWLDYLRVIYFIWRSYSLARQFL